MAPGCGHSVYRRVHVVSIGNETQVLGSECFLRLYAGTRVHSSEPRFGKKSGRLLSTEERLLLISNTQELIRRFEAEAAAEAEAAKIARERLVKEAAMADLDLRAEISARHRPFNQRTSSLPPQKRLAQFTPEQRKSVEVEARRSLHAAFGDIDLDAPGFNGLLQMEIDKILRSRMA